MTLGFTPFGIELPFPSVMLGVIYGMTYGLLAVGLVLIYRSNRIVNFAHGEIGAFGAGMFGLATIRWHVPYYVALPFALAIGFGVGALAETAVIRRLRKAPRLMTIIATLGVGEFLLAFGSAVNPQATAGDIYPEPVGLPVFNIGALRMTQAYTGMLLFAPIAVMALAVFLRRSRVGLGIRSAAANPDAARMSGIFSSRMSSIAWGLAGALSAFTAILVLPARGAIAGSSFGPTLLLRALAGAVLARMNNLPLAFAGGIGVGVVEQLLLWNKPQGSFVELSLFVIILGALMLQRRHVGREEEKGSWATVQAWRPIARELQQIWLVRNLGKIVGGVALVIAIMLPLVITHSASVIMTEIVAFSIIGLSVGILSGLGGELSLGQLALGSVGAVASYVVSKHTGNFALSLTYGGIAAGAVALAIGLPALRARGLMLTVTTLAFALVTPTWLLRQSWMFGASIDMGRPIFRGQALDSGKSYYLFALAVLVPCLWLARNVRRGAFGRQLVAVRDNEDNARAFTVRSRLVKAQSFVLAGFLAGVGGAVYGHSLSLTGTESFPTDLSIAIVAMTVIGGIGILAGPLLGALYIIGIPLFLPLDSAGLAATKLGWLVLILYVPGGIAQLIEPLRERVIRRIARRRTSRTPAEASEEPVLAGPVRTPIVGATSSRSAGRGAILEGQELQKRFGGIMAVSSVSITVRAGEIVGLIGPNGAGKTTLFELLSGFTRPDRGRVRFDGTDVTSLGPEERGRLGLIRSFQDAALFPTMTVTEAVMLANERTAPSSFFASALGLRGSERRKEKDALELVSLMGLDPYRDKQVQELSTGTRRITEIACLMALRPTVLLLDEPSSGIAQRETEALGDLLRELKRQLDATLVVIEHDIPLIMGLADRIVAMDVGRVIAEGTPDAVRRDPAVVDAYLGASAQAIERSGILTAAP
jgi:ABC-type branched-subunit amino acid transport system ATPase component/ABC-type branched-subunit amino acid transport system permease subunit